jgi:hypothetical protein
MQRGKGSQKASAREKRVGKKVEWRPAPKKSRTLRASTPLVAKGGKENPGVGDRQSKGPESSAGREEECGDKDARMKDEKDA